MDNDPIGKFQVLATLGAGAHSSILHIRRNADSKQYALKVVPIDDAEDQKYLDQAEHEYKVAQKLSHKNLIRIYKFEPQKDWLRRIRKVHLLIEYVNGDTIDNIRGLDIPHLLQIFERVADAMVHMHRRRIYHGDLKPNNVMLAKTGKVKVLDFGLAWLEGQPKHRVQGTPEYMAPEQVQRQRVNAQTDIYNFGATMYRMVTLNHPPCCIGSTDGLHLDAKTFHSMLKPVDELRQNTPPKLADLIHRCLRFKPAERPERMSEVQGTLDHIVDEMVRAPEDRLETTEW